MILQTIIALYLPPVIPSTYCSFVLLPLSDIFDTRDNDSMGHRTWTLLGILNDSTRLTNLCDLIYQIWTLYDLI